MNDNRIGDIIKTMRMSRGMSQTDVARYCDVNRSTVALWESGKRIPLVQNLEALADCFNVPLSTFLEQPTSKEVHKALVMSKYEREVRQAMQENPDMLTMFDLVRHTTPEQLKQAIQFVRFITGEKDG